MTLNFLNFTYFIVFTIQLTGVASEVSSVTNQFAAKFYKVSITFIVLIAGKQFRPSIDPIDLTHRTRYYNN